MSQIMHSGIYKIANKTTGDCYIGSAVNFEQRSRQHFSTLKNNCHDNSILQNVFNKYGLKNLSFEVIEIVNDKNKLIEREQFYIDTLNPRYNIRKIANSNLGLKWSKETKLKMSKAKKGKKMSLETRKKMSLSHKGGPGSGGGRVPGFKCSKETKNKMSLAKAKPFNIISPCGEIIQGKNLLQFCKKNNLHTGHIYEMLKGKIKHYRGWTKCVI